MKNKYIIDGMTLTEYCEKNGLNANTQRNRIKKYIQEHPGLSQEEAIKLALSKCGTRYNKFYYKGITLSEYCKKNNKNYYTMLSRINKIIIENPEITNYDATRIAIEEYNDNGRKYYYDDMPLADYCKLHPEYKYSSIRTYIAPEKEKYPKKSDQEIVNSYFEKSHNIYTRYYIENNTLKEYCEKKEISYTNVVSYMSKIRKDNPNLSANEILTKAIEKVESLTNKKVLMYKGIYLTEYCREHNLLYSSIYTKIYNLIDSENLSLEEATEKAINTFNKFGIIHYVGDMSLTEYCKYYNYEYSLLLRKIHNNISKDMDKNSAIEETIEYYERSKFNKSINEYFNMLNTNITEENLYKFLIILNIDIDNFRSLINKGYDSKTAICLIWYFNDSNFNETLSISNKKLQNILSLSNKLFKITFDYKNIINYDVFDLLGIYKSGLFDTRYLIILHFKYYIIKNINSIALYYNLQLTKEEQEDIFNEINITMLTAIDRFNNNNPSMFVSYMNKTVKGNIVNQIINIIMHSTISFNKTVGKNRVLGDIIASPNNLETEFSSDLLQIINELNDIEKKYIFYKYSREYSNLEISDIFDLSENDVDLLEETISNKLRKNQKIQDLKLTKNSKNES